MSRKLLVMGVVLAAVAGLVVLAATRSSAQLGSLLGPEKQAPVYNGDVKVDTGGIKLTSWGSGKVEAISDGYHYFEGPEVLKVTTQGPYQGVVLRFTRPPDLGAFLAIKSSFLELRVMPAQYKRVKQQAAPLVPGGGPGGRPGGRPAAGSARPGGGGPGGRGGGPGGRGGQGGGFGAVPPETDRPTGTSHFEVQLTQMMGGPGGGGPGGGPGGMPGGGPGSRAGGGPRGGPAGRGTAGRSGGPGQQPAPAGPQEIGFSARNLRLVLYTDKGVMIANEVPLEQAVKDDRGWYRVSWPLTRFSPAEGATQLQALGFFSDEADTFYLGQVRLLVDHQAVKATLKAEPSIATTARVIGFSIELTGGQIDPDIAWDFNDADGIQRQAVGPKVKYLCKQPGDYVVTATITDRSGLQPEIKKTIGIRVEKATAAEEAATTTRPGGLGRGSPGEPVIEVK